MLLLHKYFVFPFFYYYIHVQNTHNLYIELTFYLYIFFLSFIFFLFIFSSFFPYGTRARYIKVAKGFYLPKWITLIVVESALHTHHRNILKITKYQLTHMTLHRWSRKIWYLLVRKNLLICQRVGYWTWTQLTMFRFSYIIIKR